jgi:hypothetical protein
MARQGQAAAARRVERVRRQIDRWRRNRERRSPMPARLWNEASLLARELGVHRVKSALGVNYESLKRRVGEAAASRERATAKGAGFVEVPGAYLLGPASGPVVEVSDADGGRLTVQLGSGRDLDVAGLVEAFRRGRRG